MDSFGKFFYDFSPLEWLKSLMYTNVLLDELWNCFSLHPTKITSYIDAQNRFIDLIGEKYTPLYESDDLDIHRQFDEMFFCFRKELSYEEHQRTLRAVNRFFCISLTNRSYSESYELVYLIYYFGPIVYYLNECEKANILSRYPQIFKSVASKRLFYLIKYYSSYKQAKIYLRLSLSAV